MFIKLLHQRLGPHAIVEDLAELGIWGMPQYDPYEDELQNVETFCPWMKNQR